LHDLPHAGKGRAEQGRAESLGRSRPAESIASGIRLFIGHESKGGKWTFEELDQFLTHPQGYIAGTKMTFNGIQNPDQRANLIAYMRTQSDSVVPLPKAAAPSGNTQSQDGSNKAQPQQNGQDGNAGNPAPKKAGG
jgi:hypothetical protein